MVSDTTKHYPVLLNELISIISPQHGGTFIDCTFGQGGYTKKILNFGDTKVIALDRDAESKKIADKFSNKFHNRFLFKNKKFSQLDDFKLKNIDVKGVIFDLGYSTTQMKDHKKGLSFNSTGDLNMRIGINDFSAKDVINKLGAAELEKIFKFFGEEKEAKKIVKVIIKNRKTKIINTKILVDLIGRVKRKKNFKTHCATKVFQALRIFVNKEISELIFGLIAASKILKKDGILAVVTFHSIEDRIVKYFFKNLSENKSISRYLPKVNQQEKFFYLKEKKPILPSIKELEENISSRSAKLRYLVKRDDSYNFETDILKKFEYLLKIEAFGDRL